MKKYTFLSMAVVAMLFAGCNKDEGTVSLGISVENFDGPKVEMGANTTPQFVSGDQVYVKCDDGEAAAHNVTVSGGEYAINDVASASTYYAYFGNNGQISTTAAQFSVKSQRYQLHSDGKQKLTAPMVAKSTSNQLSFKNVCGLAEVTITNDDEQNASFYLESVKITASSANLGDVYSYSLTDPYGATATNTDLSKSVSIEWIYSGSNAISTSEGLITAGGNKTIYIALPPFTNNTLTIEIKGRFVNAINGSQYTYTRSTNSLSLHRNKIGALPIALSTMTRQAAPYFSVGASTHVAFSSGNLQYNPAQNAWRFAPEQYNTIGSGNSTSYDDFDGYNGWLDLFGWGSGLNPANVSTTNSNYSTFNDWGQYCGLTSGSVNRWRTLTQGEWDYLLNTRSNASSKKGFAIVAGVQGLVILPDNWTGNAIASSYTTSSWEDMENNGAIFLPVTGARDGTTFDMDYVEMGLYWTSTSNTDGLAYVFGFYNGEIQMFEYDRYEGLAVRLVHNY